MSMNDQGDFVADTEFMSQCCKRKAKPFRCVLFVMN